MVVGVRYKRGIMVFIAILLTFGAMVLFPSLGVAEDIPMVRVAIATGASNLTVQGVEGEYLLVDGSTNLPVGRLSKGQNWQFAVEGLSIRVTGPGGSNLGSTSSSSSESAQFPSNPNGTFKGPMVLKPEEPGKKAVFSLNGKRYRGSLTILNQDGGLLAVNVLDLEKYLYGVVGPEMGVAPDEALKTQAVVSRTYVMNYLGKSPYYDVGPSTVHQVYKGYDAEDPKVIRAVDATAGQVILYDGRLIQAYFHANAGGYTEDSENVWMQSLPYLRATPTPEDAYAATLAGYPASTYEWQEEFTREDVEKRLAARGIKVGNLIDIRVSRNQREQQVPTRSGRATQVDLVGTEDIYSVYRDNIRGILGKNGSLKSTLFELKLDSAVTVLDQYGNKREINYGGDLYGLAAGDTVSNLNGADSAYRVLGRGGETRALPKVFQKVVVNGKGYGHGLGMSQWGARGLAESGHTYKEIIEHYYNQSLNNGRLRVVSNYGR